MTPIDRLGREVVRIADTTGGIVGIGARHLESTWEFGLNPDALFHMASAYKLPIAVRLLSLVDNGHIRLNQTVNVSPSTLAPGSGIISSRFSHLGVSLSILNLLELMLIVSDNTASDILLELGGGPSAVTEFLQASGIRQMRVDRSAKEVLSGLAGISEAMAEQEWSLERFQALNDAVPEEARAVAHERYFADDRDTTTAPAMAGFLTGLFRGEFLCKETTRLILEMMQRCETGRGRLKGILPTGTVVAHKSGTLARKTITDVGIITLPDSRGHLVIAVFVKAPRISDIDCEVVIAQVARALYDFLLFSA